jgi:hypothetical protein
VTGSRESKSIEIAQETPDGWWNSIEGSFAGEDGLVTIIWSTWITMPVAHEVFFQRQ